MSERFRIGQLAARSGRSVHAIRWYEAQGLIPGVERDPSGRRVYGEEHVSWLGLMERLRRTGMSIGQMREYTALVKQGKPSLRQRQTLLQDHRARVQATIADLHEALDLIDRKVEFYGQWLRSGRRPRELPRAGLARTALRRTRNA